jgi:dolichol-phosphate mannosyltransferase
VVLLPTYNEAGVLGPVIDEVRGYAGALPDHALHVLIVDGGSTDGTAELARARAAADAHVHLLETKRGLGLALVQGYRYAMDELRPDVIAQIDADGQSSPEVLVKLVEGVDQGCDLVIGSRFVPGGRNELPFYRRLFSSGSSLVFRLLVGPRSVREVTNMARAFTPDLLAKLDLDALPWEAQSFIFLPAFLHEAIRAGARCREVPLVFKSRAGGYSKNRVLLYTWNMLAYCLSVRLHGWSQSARKRGRKRWSPRPQLD